MAMFPCNIGESSGGGNKHVVLVGTHASNSSNHTFDYDSIDRWFTLNESNFIVELTDRSDLTTKNVGGSNPTVDSSKIYGGELAGFTVIKTLDRNVGRITIGGLEYDRIRYCQYSDGTTSILKSASGGFGYKVYAIY